MSTAYGYGREELVYAREETVFGNLMAVSAAMKVLSTDFKMTQERMDRKEKGSTRSIIDRVTRKKSVDWTINKYILPSGTAGTPPDDMLLFEYAMGVEAIDAGNKVTYTLAAEPNESLAKGSLSLIRHVGTVSEGITGALPNTMEISFGGGEEPKVAFVGLGADLLTCGRDTTDGDHTDTAEVTVNNSLQFQAGMLVSVGDEDNFEINSIAHDTKILSLDHNVVNQSSGAAVVPRTMGLTPVTTGDVIPVIVGSVDFDTGTLYPVTSGRVTLNNNLIARNDEFGSELTTGYRYPSFREVTFSLELYLLAADVKLINDSKRFTQKDIGIILGGTAGKMLTINMNQTEFAIPPITIPEEGEITISIEGKALGSSGEDELQLVFN